MLKIVEKTKIWLSISLIIIAIGVFFLVTKGLNLGIDFKGGTIIQIDMEKKFDKFEVEKIVHKYSPEAVTNIANETELEIKTSSMDEDKISEMYKEIKQKYNLKANEPIGQDNIGASLGKEMKRKAMTSLIIATIGMLLYIGIRFEFKFGIAAILCLIHDVFIMISIYAIFQIPIDSGFVAAILTVVGYSINDTIVVFDRVRENQKYMRKSNYTELANASITQTIARSINTIFTSAIMLISVYFFVPAIRNFSKPILIGLISGCYSSIFIATPLWVIFKNKAGGNKVGVKG